MKKQLLSVIALSLFGVLCLVGHSWSQDDNPQPIADSKLPTPGQNATSKGPEPTLEEPIRVNRPLADANGAIRPSSSFSVSTYGPTQMNPDGSIVSYTAQPLFGFPVPSKIQKLMDQLREANDDSKKAELTKELESIIVAAFDDDLKSRETDLKKLEERLAKLRNQLNRRKEAKAEIIQLQLKVMVNEAEGLGFSGVSRPGILPQTQDILSPSIDLNRKGQQPETLPLPVPR